MSFVLDSSVLNKELNKEQSAAALQIQGPMLIIAGAGSGKTRTITYKMAHLISAHRVPSNSILAVTFTNKAAREMRERIHQILGERVELQWMGTFHSICVRILRTCLGNPGIRNSIRTPFTAQFSIYDDDDQKRVIRQILKEDMGDLYDASELRKVRALISKFKNSVQKEYGVDSYKVVLQSPAVVEQNAEYGEAKKIASYYKAYQKKLAESNAMDFDDLLFHTTDILQKIPPIAEQFARRFKYVVVDEYQDTNDVQYELLKLLMNPEKNVTVVGDDDQSIYGWRGANIEIIRNFHRDFSPVKIVKLEENYRSTSNIVQGAGSVIANNERPQEMKKVVFSKQEKGDLIQVIHLDEDRGEAERIASTIFGAGTSMYSKTAIFYRTNAQSRAIEKALNDYRIPCVIYGGTRFWDRKEIKDILAYLRVLSNPKDDAALLRIVNVPPRQIGAASISRLLNSAEEVGLSLWETLSSPMIDLGPASSKFKSFSDLVNKWFQMIEEAETPLPILVEHIIEDINYKSFLKKEDDATSDERELNLDEMVNAIREFDEENPDASLDAFLQDISLLTDADKKVEEATEKVTLMTMHMAKGLEFHTVHIAGCDEELFPLIRVSTMMNPKEELKQIEEERRLFYVGCTRAEKKLFLYHTERRFWQGSFRNFAPSRFLEEMDPTVVHVELENSSGFSFENSFEKKYGNSNSKTFDRNPKAFSSSKKTPSFQRSFSYKRPDSFSKKKNDTQRIVYKNPIKVSKPSPDEPRLVYDEYSEMPFKPGVKVFHSRFKTGVILKNSGQGENARVEVRFQDGVVRTLILKFASLELIQ